MARTWQLHRFALGLDYKCDAPQGARTEGFARLRATVATGAIDVHCFPRGRTDGFVAERRPIRSPLPLQSGKTSLDLRESITPELEAAKCPPPIEGIHRNPPLDGMLTLNNPRNHQKPTGLLEELRPNEGPENQFRHWSPCHKWPLHSPRKLRAHPRRRGTTAHAVPKNHSATSPPRRIGRCWHGGLGWRCWRAG